MPLVKATIVNQALATIMGKKVPPQGTIGFDGTGKPIKGPLAGLPPAYQEGADPDKIMIEAIVDAILTALASGVTVNMTGGTMNHLHLAPSMGVGGGVPGPVQIPPLPIASTLTSISATTAMIS